jgi:hypothetical protein
MLDTHRASVAGVCHQRPTPVCSAADSVASCATTNGSAGNPRQLPTLTQPSPRNDSSAPTRSGCAPGSTNGQQFRLAITDTTRSITRDQQNIDAETALDGIYVIRTIVAGDDLGAAGVLGAYKNLGGVRGTSNPSRPSTPTRILVGCWRV